MDSSQDEQAPAAPETVASPGPWKMWAGTRVGPDQITYFCRLGASPREARFRGVTDPIEVLVTEEAEGPYWGWLGVSPLTERPSEYPSMIQEREVLFRVGFPYGYQAAEDAGRGRHVRLRIEAVETQERP